MPWSTMIDFTEDTNLVWREPRRGVVVNFLLIDRRVNNETYLWRLVGQDPMDGKSILMCRVVAARFGESHDIKASSGQFVIPTRRYCP